MEELIAHHMDYSYPKKVKPTIQESMIHWKAYLLWELLFFFNGEAPTKAKLKQPTGTQKQPYQHVNDSDFKRWAHFWGSTQPYRNHSKFSLKKSLLI